MLRNAIVALDSGTLCRQAADALRYYEPPALLTPLDFALVGFGYALWTIWTQSHVTNSSVLLIIFSVIVFLVGLVSEQISALRFEGRH